MNFIHKDTTPDQLSQLFGDMDGDLGNDVFIEIDDSTRLEDIVVKHLKKFQSNTQARKNGWGGDIPKGYKEWSIGKTHFYSFKPIEERDWDNDEHLLSRQGS